MTFNPLTYEGRVLIAVTAVTLSSLACWIVAFRRSNGFKGAIDLLAPESPKTAAFWNPLDVAVLIFATLFGVQLVYTAMAAADLIQLPIQSFEFVIQTDPLATIVCVVLAQWIAIIGCTIVLSRRGPAWTSIGWPFRRGDFMLGLLWSLLLIPPTLWINYFVGKFVPYEHDVLDALQMEHDPFAIALLFIATALVTPIAEEFMFRGLLQSALTRIASVLQLRRDIQASRSTDDSARTLAESTSFRAGSSNVALWPIYVSSGIFALLHLGQGAAAIPLFFFALGLGWLYRRTGRLWPSIFVHMILNGLSLAVTIAAPGA